MKEIDISIKTISAGLIKQEEHYFFKLFDEDNVFAAGKVRII